MASDCHTIVNGLPAIRNRLPAIGTIQIASNSDRIASNSEQIASNRAVNLCERWRWLGGCGLTAVNVSADPDDTRAACVVTLHKRTSMQPGRARPCQ